MDLHAFANDAAHVGWIAALLIRTTSRLERYLGLWIFRVNVRALASPSPDSTSLPKDITVRAIHQPELIELAKDPELELDPAFIQEAISRGDLAFGAFEQGQLVGYTWRTFCTAPFFEGLWIKVPRPFTYGYKSYTLPLHRGRGIHGAFSTFADRQTKESGHPALLALIDIANRASLRASSQMGSRKAGYAVCVRLFGQCFIFRTPAARSCGIDFYTPGSRALRALVIGPPAPS